MKKLFGALALFASVGLAGSANASLQSLTNLFVFGDSLSDGGNSGLASSQFVPPAPYPSGIVYPPSPYYNGQYSNGPVAVEYLWNSYNPGNTSFKPSLAGGTNYSMGGATTGTANFNSVSLVGGPFEFLAGAYQDKGNAWELQGFLNRPNKAFDPATSLFVIWLFPNDVFYSTATGMLPGTVLPILPGGANLVENGIANILTTIQTLAFAGAQHFLVPNMPDLGATPEFLGTPTAGPLSVLTNLFNSNLAAQLDVLDDLLPVEIVQFDTHALFEKLLANPTAYGFDVANMKCIDNLLNGQCNPDTWVFWDGVHPTTAAHRFLGEQFAAAVPEPASVLLLALGLFAIAASCKRQSL